MDTQIAPSPPHNYQDDRTGGVVHSIFEGKEEDHQEKKSVLEKAKDKAKKIKHALTKKAHGSEEDNEDNEEDPQVHVNESTTAYKITSLDETPAQPGTSLASMRPSEGDQNKLNDLPPVEEDPHAPKERLPSPFSYQTKVADPTASGGEEAGVPPLDQSFQAMKLSNEAPLPTGSHDLFSPKLPPSQNAPAFPETSSPVPDPSDKSQPSKIQTPTATAEKISSATSAVSPREYGRKIAEKLAPVYGKVAQAGSAVVGKLQGGRNQRESEETESPESRVKVEETEGGVKQSEKGVSVKEFVAEKIRPGEEHKALSEMITDAIRRRKGEPESGSDAPAVASGGSVSGTTDGAGKGLLERVTGAVGSMLGFGGGSRASHIPESQSRVNAEGADRDVDVTADDIS